MAKIAQETIEQIAAANDIVEVIGSYFPLKRAGALYKALCPFHHEKTPSFTVNPQRQIFKCFGCGAGGSVFKFVSLYENVDFPSAVRRLAERAGVRIVEEQLSADDDRRYRMRKRLLALHNEAAEWFHANLLEQPEAKIARDYLKKRAIGREIAQHWKIGYALDARDAFSVWAKSRGYSREELLQSGLAKLRDDDQPQQEHYDRFRGRVIFPIHNDVGEVIAFSGRVLDPEAKAAKYINSPETMLFIKGNVLFGLHKSKRALIDKGTAIVCEGQLDLITAYETGVQNVIAPQGTAFTDKQARTLKRYVEEAILCFDSDLAGEKATERSLGALLATNVVVRVAEMPAGHDPDSFVRANGAEAFVALTDNARDFFDFQIERQTAQAEFATPRGKMQFAKKMAEAAGLITDPVYRENIFGKLAARLELPLDSIRGMTPSVRYTSAEEEQRPAQQQQLSTTMQLLCLVALRDADSRQWLLSQNWKQLLDRNDDGALLIKILEGDFNPEKSSSLAAFAATLPSEEEALVSGLLLERMPSDCKAVVEDCWRHLEKRQIKGRQEVLASRMRLPNLTIEEISALQKEILDLQKQLTDIARPFSPAS